MSSTYNIITTTTTHKITVRVKILKNSQQFPVWIYGEKKSHDTIESVLYTSSYLNNLTVFNAAFNEVLVML